MRKFILFFISMVIFIITTVSPGSAFEPLKLKWSRLLTFEKICKPGKLIVASSSGNPQYLVDMSNGEIIYQTDPNTEAGLSTNYFGTKFYFYKKGEMDAQCYDVISKKFLGTTCASESSDNSTAVFIADNNTFIIGNCDLKKTTDSVKIPNSPNSLIYSTWNWEYSLDSRYFALSLIKGLTPYFYLYDRNTKEFLFQGKQDFKYCLFNKTNKMAYAENIKLTGDDTIYSYIRIYDPDQRKVIQDIKIAKVHINNLAIKMDDNYIIYGLSDGYNTMGIYDYSKNKIIDNDLKPIGSPVIYADDSLIITKGLCGNYFDWSVDVKDNLPNEDSVIYPNPVNNLISITIPIRFYSGNWQILNITGKIMMKGFILPQNKLQIDASNLLPQSYFLSLKKDNLAKTYKLVKQ